ncbi:MAG TPA: DUF1553 domain-containing protein, partial [Pirellulaceae bacterium]|nr:DUF1553 domain-containing protein [Pirellulaceae bacterium]
PASRDNAIGLVWEAKLKVPADGEYRFDGDGTEGFKLTVGGQVVLDRPQLGHQKGDGKIKLKAGLIPLRLDWFNSVQKPSIELTWTLPTGETRSLTESGQSQAARTFVADSREKPRRWQYTTEKPTEDWTKLAFDDAAWKRGPGGFGQQGTPGAVVRTPWNSQNIWLRTKFTLKDSQDLPRGLTLNVHHDEDVEVYLNGVRVYAATGFLRDYTQVALDAAALQALQVGENVLAVHCRQTGGGQYIDVGLTDGRARIDVARQIRDQGAKLLGDDTAKRYVALVKQLEESRKAKPEEPGAEVMCVTESGRSETNVLLRGNPHALGEKVQPGVPAVLSEDPNAVLPAAVLKGPAASASSGKRRALAEWLTSKQNPLTARVMANRLWQNHFGLGIVPTPNDFGQLGEQPSHPELLDWLASELMAGDWRLKRMHKLIMLTDAYRRSSHGDAAALEKDPANHLLWRYNMRRLTAEEVRDTVLAASGQLNLKPGGPSIYPPIPREVLAGQSRPGAGWGNSPPEEASRRSIYIHVKRSLLVPILSDHDVADTDSSCPVRYVTTVPTQSLGMLNGDFTNEQARKMVERLKRERPGDLDQQIRWAVRLTTGRSPTDAEVAADRKMIVDLREKHKLSDDAALAQFCLLCINANEFIYLD